ncbi:MAG: triphosphoribosyl-dephospho-CoA synthase [Candidatus Heimdallarchaeota archaeon]
MTYLPDQTGKGPEQIASLGCLASILEVYGYPKPGNVHRFADAEDTTMLHFLASSIAIFSPLVRAGKVGDRIGKTEIPPNDAEIGSIILACMKNVRKWGIYQNTNLGIVLLLVPLAIAAGAAHGKMHRYSIEDLRYWLEQILENSTFEDAICVSKAIALANPSGLGTSSKFDIHSESLEAELKSSNATLLDLFTPAKSRDLIASEYTTSFHITFKDSAPFVTKLDNHFCLEERTVLLFLHLLSSYPDSHILRNKGYSVAEKIRADSENFGTPESLLEEPARLWEFDRILRQNSINPGTIADLTAAGLFVSLLDLFQRPDFNGLDFGQSKMAKYFNEMNLWSHR